MSKTIYYACKYAPLELFAGYGATFSALDPLAESFSCAERCAHANLCGYAKAVLEQVEQSGIRALVLTNCCDAMLRVYDVLAASGKMEFLQLLPVPHQSTPATRARFARDLRRLADALQRYTGQEFDAQRAHAFFVHKPHAEGPHLTLLGAHGGSVLYDTVQKAFALPVVDATCTGNRELADVAPAALEDFLPGYAAALLGQVLLDPATENGVFRADYVAGEKANLLDRIRGQINDKRVYASHRLAQVMCREEAFGVDKLGDETSAASVTPDSLWQRYQALLNTAAVEVYYSGSAQPERAARALTAALSGLSREEERLEPECEVRLHAGPEPQLVEERLEVSQGKLALGFRTGGITCWEEEYPALVLCNAIFGGTPLSKLFLDVREKLSLCYYASSVLEKMKGLVLVSSGIEFDKYQQAKDEILAQLEAIRRGEIEDWELEGARRTLISGHLSTLDDQGRLEEFWLGQAAAGLDTGVEELAGRLASVTREQVAAAARRLELDTVYFLKGQED